MDRTSECKNQTIFAVAGILLLAISNLNNVHASSLKSLFKDSGMEFGGWINGGGTYNANNPSDGFNGAERINSCSRWMLRFLFNFGRP